MRSVTSTFQFGFWTRVLYLVFLLCVALREILLTKISFTIGDFEIPEVLLLAYIVTIFFLATRVFFLAARGLWSLLRFGTLERIGAWERGQGLLRAGFRPPGPLDRETEEAIENHAGMVRWYLDELLRLLTEAEREARGSLRREAAAIADAVRAMRDALHWSMIAAVDPNEVAWSSLGKARAALQEDRKQLEHDRLQLHDLITAEAARVLEDEDRASREAAVEARAEVERATETQRQLAEQQASLAAQERDIAQRRQQVEHDERQLQQRAADVYKTEVSNREALAQLRVKEVEVAGLVARRDAWGSYAADRLLQEIAASSTTGQDVLKLIAEQYREEQVS